MALDRFRTHYEISQISVSTYGVPAALTTIIYPQVYHNCYTDRSCSALIFQSQKIIFCGEKLSLLFSVRAKSSWQIVAVDIKRIFVTNREIKDLHLPTLESIQLSVRLKC